MGGGRELLSVDASLPAVVLNVLPEVVLNSYRVPLL